MNRLLFILLLISFQTLHAQTGIGTTAPVNKFEVVAATADPATTGAAANGNLRLGPSSGSHVLDFGLSASSTYAWLQARSRSGYGTTFNLALNPIGGNVGIGTSSPTSILTVGRADGGLGAELLLNPAATVNEGGQLTLKRSLTGSLVDWTIDQYGTTSANARLRIFSGVTETNGINILENGNVGIGTNNPTTRLFVNGDITANSISGTSDIRYKTNIRTLENALDKVKALRGVYFNWDQKSFPDKNFSDNTELGFIAQEVEKVLPEVVSKDKTTEGYRSVKYDKVVALLVEAIKEQQKQIDSLRSEVNRLTKKRNK